MGTVEKLLERLSGQKVYLDANIFIYFLDRNPLFFDSVAPIVEAAESGVIIGCTGDAVIAEVLVKPYRIEDISLIASIKAFFCTDNFLSICSHDSETFDLAARLRAKHNLKFIDALHFATAINAGCKAMITNDSGIRSSDSLEVISLSSLLHGSSE